MGVILTTYGPSPGSRSFLSSPLFRASNFSPRRFRHLGNVLRWWPGVPMEFPCHPKAELICWIPFCTYNICVFGLNWWVYNPRTFTNGYPKWWVFDRYRGLQTYWRHFGYAKIQGGILAGTSESSVNVLLDVGRRPVWLSIISALVLSCVLKNIWRKKQHFNIFQQSQSSKGYGFSAEPSIYYFEMISLSDNHVIQSHKLMLQLPFALLSSSFFNPSGQLHI